MFFRKWIIKSNLNIKKFKNVEYNRILLKSLLSNPDFNNMQRFYFSFIFNRYYPHITSSFYRRFCIISKYPKSVFRFFKLSRFVSKDFASKGLLVGMRKSSF